MSKFLPLMRQHYNDARKVLINLAKSCQEEDSFLLDMLLIAFDLQIQFSLLKLKTIDEEINLDEIRHFDNVCSAAHIFEFLALSEGIDMTYKKLAALSKRDFDDFVYELSIVLKKYTSVLFDFLNSFKNTVQFDLFCQTVSNCLVSASEMEIDTKGRGSLCHFLLFESLSN